MIPLLGNYRKFKLIYSDKADQRLPGDEKSRQRGLIIQENCGWLGEGEGGLLLILIRVVSWMHT